MIYYCRLQTCLKYNHCFTSLNQTCVVKVGQPHAETRISEGQEETSSIWFLCCRPSVRINYGLLFHFPTSSISVLMGSCHFCKCFQKQIWCPELKNAYRDHWDMSEMFGTCKSLF